MPFEQRQRYVLPSLIMVGIIVIGSGVVGGIDPFESGEPWLNGFSLALGGILGVYTSLFVAIATNKESDIHSIATMALLFFLGAAIFAGLIGAGLGMVEVDTHLVGIIWSGYVAMLLVYLLNSMVMFLARK